MGHVREANGAGSLAELRARLTRIRDGANIAVDPGGRIGCSLIAEATLFPREAWIPQPRDWKVRTQSGEGYDLDQGEGRRILETCLAHAGGTAARTALAPEATPQGERYGQPRLHRPRLGQGIFRVQVLDAYDRACAITGEHSLPVLEAAHVRPYALGGEHAVDNGVVLRTDLHRLFDHGYVTIDGELRLVVGTRLKADFDNGRSYYGMQGTALRLPTTLEQRPLVDALRWHREHVFLG